MSVPGSESLCVNEFDWGLSGCVFWVDVELCVWARVRI